VVGCEYFCRLEHEINVVIFILIFTRRDVTFVAQCRLCIWDCISSLLEEKLHKHMSRVYLSKSFTVP
jgi:dolichol kinase